GRFAHKVVGASLQARGQILLTGMRGEHQDVQIMRQRCLPNALTQTGAIQSGHIEVGNQDVEGLFENTRERTLTVRHSLDDVACLAYQVLQNQALGGIILRQKYFDRFRLCGILLHAWCQAGSHAHRLKHSTVSDRLRLSSDNKAASANRSSLAAAASSFRAASAAAPAQTEPLAPFRRCASRAIACASLLATACSRSANRLLLF